MRKYTDQENRFLERLGITPGPWGYSVNYVPYEYDYCTIKINDQSIDVPSVAQNENNVRCAAHSTDMFLYLFDYCYNCWNYATKKLPENVLQKIETLENSSCKKWFELRKLWEDCE